MGMKPMKVGIIGCGAISGTYLANSKKFDAFDVLAVADKRMEAAEARAKEFEIPKACSVEDLLADPEIETVTGTTHLEIPMSRERGGDGSYSLEELALGFVRLAGGITLTIEVACALHPGGTGRSLRPSCVFGSKGGVCLSPFSYHTTVADMEMDATFDIDLADWRWHECFPDVDAYDSPQVHWIAALQNRVSLVDTAGITLATAKISDGIYLSHRLRKELSVSEIERMSQSNAVEV